MRIAYLFFCILTSFVAVAEPAQLDLDAIVDALQRRYATVETISGAFQQTYRAPGIYQNESGVFRMKRPGLMRWEYRQPEEKIFIADGREVSLYSPRDRQVTVQPYRASDIHSTPLEFLLGGADIRKTFSVSPESLTKPAVEQTAIVRLTPRTSRGEYEYLVLEIDTKTYDLRRIVIREHGGNTSDFLLTNVTVNAKIGKNYFQFKPPKDVEVVRLDSME